MLSTYAPPPPPLPKASATPPTQPYVCTPTFKAASTRELQPPHFIPSTFTSSSIVLSAKAHLVSQNALAHNRHPRQATKPTPSISYNRKLTIGSTGDNHPCAILPESGDPSWADKWPAGHMLLASWMVHTKRSVAISHVQLADTFYSSTPHCCCCCPPE